MAEAVKPQGCTNLKLRQLGRRVARLYDEDMRALGLRGTQYSLLSYIVRFGPVGQAPLAATMGLDPSTLTRNLQPMVAAGWVRVEAGGDARSHLVVATEAGLALRERAQQAWKCSQMALNHRLGDQRVARLHALIDECSALLDSAADPTAGADTGPAAAGA
jgi:DNA-binding MarR family transcriptional regulator